MPLVISRLSFTSGESTLPPGARISISPLAQAAWRGSSCTINMPRVSGIGSLGGGATTRRAGSGWTTVRPPNHHSPHQSSLLTFCLDFIPAPGAAGYQVSNPNIMSLTALRASLSVFAETSMSSLRTKSVHLTGYLEHLLRTSFPSSCTPHPFKIITPVDPQQRGAQLSLLFREGLMLPVYEVLHDEGIVVDERKPDVIRVAPVPMYNTFEDCWRFVDALKRGLERVGDGSQRGGEGGEVEREAREMLPTSA